MRLASSGQNSIVFLHRERYEGFLPSLVRNISSLVSKEFGEPPMKPSYYQRYNQLLNKFSAKALYNLVLCFAKKLGNPYEEKQRGRKPKLKPYEYAAYVAYMILVKGMPYRGMEFESDLYVDKHIDHSTLVVNFEKIPVEYFLELVEQVGARLDVLLEHSEHYVVDSTAVTTPITFITEIKGKRVKEKVEYRSHAIVSLHPEDNSVVVRKGLATSKHVADCEGAKRMLDEGKITNIILHGDRGYDYERVYKACYQHAIKPNIRPMGYQSEIGSYRLNGIAEYDDEMRKKYRGRVEVVFGGITNAGLMTTRLRKEAKILSYSAIILLRQNILTLARALASWFELLTKLGFLPSGT